jgi:hypothetical protein
MVMQFDTVTRKRLLLGLLVAVVGAVLLAVFASPAEASVVMANPCSKYTSSDWQYWAMSCWAF